MFRNKWRVLVSILHVLMCVNLVSAAENMDTLGEGCLKGVTLKGEQVGEFPLKHTQVNVKVSGYIARVEVKQLFTNPYQEKIEAVYVFPLPQDSAVDDMLIKVGERTIKGDIKKKAEAKQIYENAKQQGHIAALLEQERPNIFTQSVANIVAGDKIEVVIRYVQVLKYDEGAYEYSFPMVVGPRFIPGNAIDTPSDGGWACNTDKVPDASRITPPVIKPGERSGHDINITLDINSGVNMSEVTSPSHKIDVVRVDDNQVKVKLHPGDSIPNKDFTLRYKVATDMPQYALLTHKVKTDPQGYYLLMIQPKEKYSPQELTPKEMIFVIDSSGSMSGQPIEKAKEVVRRFVKGMNPSDTFQILNFSNSVSGFSPYPVENTPENVQKALSYIDNLQGEGGTMMIEGIKAALDYLHYSGRIRIVTFLTDGYIGNETEILAAMQDKLKGARLFSFGVGSSVNRYLLDNMAKVGRGFVQYVRPDEDTYQVVERFFRRLNNPCLTDVTINYENLEVADTYPEQVPDLFDSQPLFIYGKYYNAGRTEIEVTGFAGTKRAKIKVPVEFPQENNENEVIATIWARQKIEDLMSQQYGGEKPQIVDQVTELALRHRLMSQYTSFVAVEETFIVEGGTPKKVMVPVEMPEFVSYEGVFGKEMNKSLSFSNSLYSRSFVAGESLTAWSSNQTSGPANVPYKKSPGVISMPAPVQTNLAQTKPNNFKITLTDKTKSLSYEIDSLTGYLFKINLSEGKKTLLKKINQTELTTIKQLLTKLNIAQLNNQVFQDSAECDINITIENISLSVSFGASSGIVMPQTVIDLKLYLQKLFIH